MSKRDLMFIVNQMTSLREHIDSRFDSLDRRLDRVEARLDQVNEDILALKLVMHSHPEEN